MTDNDDDKELALQLHRELNALGKRRRRGDESKSQTASDQSDRDSDDDSSDDSQDSAQSNEETRARKKLKTLGKLPRAAALDTIAQRQKKSKTSKSLKDYVKCFATGVPWCILIPRSVVLDGKTALEKKLLDSWHHSGLPQPAKKVASVIAISGTGDIMKLDGAESSSEDVYNEVSTIASRLYVQFDKEE